MASSPMVYSVLERNARTAQAQSSGHGVLFYFPRFLGFYQGPLKTMPAHICIRRTVIEVTCHLGA